MTFNRDDFTARTAALPDWMEEFANKELKKGGNPFEDIKNIFKNNPDAVEDRVKELRARVGLDLVAQDEPPAQEKTASQKEEKAVDPHQAAKKIQNLVAFANNLEDAGMVEKAKEVDLQIKAMLDDLTPKHFYQADDKKKDDETPEVLRGCPELQVFIDNICRSRQGHINIPSLLKMIRDERNEDVDVSDEGLHKYIEKRLKEERRDDPCRNEDIAGMEPVAVLVVTDEDDGNREVFDKPARL